MYKKFIEERIVKDKGKELGEAVNLWIMMCVQQLWRRVGRKKDGLGRVSVGTVGLRTTQAGWWGLLEQMLPIGGVHVLLKWACISSPAMFSYLGVADEKHDLRINCNGRSKGVATDGLSQLCFL